MHINPKSQSLFIGHEKVEASIIKQINAQQPHHAYILSGPAGVGKATFAFRVAKYIFSGSNHDSSLDVDPGLAVVSRIISGGHGDLHYIEPEALKESAMISVDQIRQMSKFFSQKSMEGGYRIAIIDGQLNRNAANALLKILEEPPARAIIFLIVDALGKLLPTIRSRCQSVKFSALNLDQTTTVLKSLHLNKETSEVAVAGMGAPGKALWLLQRGGVEIYTQFIATINAALRNDLLKVNEFCLAYSTKSTSGEGDVLPAIGQMFLDLIYRYTSGEINENEAPLFKLMAQSGSLNRWAQNWQDINILFKQLAESHLDKFQVLVTSFSKFSPKYRND